MKALYPAAWLMIILFLGWSGNLLLNIEAIWSEASDLHKLSSNFDTLVETWRNLNRPGNDVLENYEVDKQRAAFEVYAENFETASDVVLELTHGKHTLTPLLEALEVERGTLTVLAQEIFDLTEQRESLRLSNAPEEAIREKETEAAKRMAIMDQKFQDGLDYILRSNDAVLAYEQTLEVQQRDNFKRLYMMLLVALIASALSVQLLRRTSRQREALSDSAARINTIMDNVIDGIVTVDENGRIESINPPAERMFKYSKDELIGREFSMLLYEGCQDVYHDHLSSGSELVIPSFDSNECEMRGRRPDGSTFPIELALTRVVVHGRELRIHLVRDISERKRAEEEAKLHQEELVHVMRLSTMGEMASGMAHELNQPLTAVASYCKTAQKMVEDQTTVPEKLSDILARAQEQTHRAGDIIRRLRNFVSKGGTQKEPVDIDKLIRDVMELLEWELRNSRVKIDFNQCGNDCMVMVDKVQIEQVLLNLVRNSLEAIQNAAISEGRVLLETHRLPAKLVEVTVSDNGPGVDEEMIDTLFNPFQTNKGTGMGMGLSISRSIIEAHGGKLWVAKVTSDGAVFGFKLPLAGA